MSFLDPVDPFRFVSMEHRWPPPFFLVASARITRSALR
jgi:hypothetical protein